MSQHDKNLSQNMPPLTPLVMPDQDFSRPFHDPSAPPLKPKAGTTKYRLATFIPAFLTMAALIAVFSDWFSKGGFTSTELIILTLVAFSSFWIALSVAASTIGLFFARKPKRIASASADNALSVALLVPIYNEAPKAVYARIHAMHDELCSTQTYHQFAFFILSDTRDEAIAEEEWFYFQQLRQQFANSPVPFYYRRREQNIERKTGNIRNWVESWGGAYDSFITLDADSLMSAKTLISLADALVTKPDTALIQSIPRLIRAHTLFARTQQFSNNIYGGLLAQGLERWSGTEGNYWGHNAIIRTQAFAHCAGLPQLSGRGTLSGTIKSHDFVEAALLRRGGWGVCMMPLLNESYEETPQNLIDYVLRDRRWCQGNMQHIRLLFSKGFAGASRFHMLQGAMAYIASAFWFLLLIIWTLMGRSEENSVFQYFTDSNPLFPVWPEMDTVNRLVVLSFMFVLLLTPKLMAIAKVIWQKPRLQQLGGPYKFALSCVVEIILSILFAPLLMVHHVKALLRTLWGKDTGWAPQNRSRHNYSLSLLLRFHWLETLVGILLMSGTYMGVITYWLLPIAISFCIAVPISYFTSLPLAQKAHFLMATREDLVPCPIIIKSHIPSEESTEAQAFFLKTSSFERQKKKALS